MKQFLVFSSFLFSLSTSFAQTRDVKQLYDTAKSLMRQGDYDNAIPVLNNALQQEPGNLDIQKDLAFVNYLKRDFSKSIEIGKSIVKRPDADEQSYQILGMSYKGIAEYKECRKLYEKALQKFPKSGVLYNESGELMAMNKEMDNAIALWEKGIQVDPNYSSNYYNAAIYYAQTENLFWAIIYGEIFINLESYSTRTADIKGVLLETYKKLYAKPDITKWGNSYKNADFVKGYFETLSKSAALASEGITPDNLTAIRTRFILDWYNNKYNEKFPFRLFDQQRYLLREGLFDAYNQWIFGIAANPSAYEVWAGTHDKQAAAFKQFQQSRVFKIPLGQYYH